MDLFNNLPLYVWVIVISIIVILIVLFVFIMKRRAKEAQELDAMFEPAWNDEYEEGVDRATIQRRRREERARRQKEVESRRDSGTRRSKNQREKEETDPPSKIQTDEEPQDIVNKGFSLEGEGDEKPSLRSNPPFKEELESEKLTQDESLDRLGSLPSLGRWQQKEEEGPAAIEREEEEPMYLGNLPPRRKGSFLESEGISESEEERHMHRKGLQQPRTTRSSLEDTGLRRLGGLPPLDTSRFQKQPEMEPSTPKQDLAGEEKESLHRTTLSEETTGESPVKQQDFQPFAGGIPSRATSEPVSGATPQAKSEEEKGMFPRRSRFLSDKKAEGIPEEKHRGVPPLEENLPPSRVAQPEVQGPKEIFETREGEESAGKPKRTHLRRSPISRVKEAEEPTIPEDGQASFDESLPPQRAFPSEEAALGARGKGEAREDPGLQRRYLRRSSTLRKEEVEEPALQEESVSPIEESFQTRRASQFETKETASSLETGEQREKVEGSEQKRVLRRSSATRKEGGTTSSIQEQDTLENPPFPRRRPLEEELQQRVSTSSTELKPDIEEKQGSSSSEAGQGLGPRSRRQKNRWNMPWGKKE